MLALLECPLNRTPGACRFFRRLRSLLLASAPLLSLAIGAPTAWGAIYYVDGNCPNSGNGSSIACGSAGGSGPFNSLQAGIDRLSAPGDVLRVRGVHPAHDGEAASSDGRYHGDWFTISNKNGASGNPIIIEAFNYGGPSQETVFIDGTMAPSGGWTRCTDCSSGACAGVPGTCGDVWYATSSGLSSMVIGAQRADGVPTYRVSSPSALTNLNSSYSSYTAGGRILVRWGPQLPTKPYVFYNNNGYGFFVGFNGKSSYVTIRGFTLRAHRRSGFLVIESSPPSTNIVIENNKIFHSYDVQGQGSDYGIGSYGGTNLIIRGNEIANTGSEGIHLQAVASGPTVVSIEGNWIHDIGDQTVSGPDVKGTPWGLILGDHGGGTGNGDYSGSVIENNLIERQANNGSGSVGGGAVLENNSSNWVIRNNVFRDSARECLKFDANGVATNNNEVYNNVFFNCGLNPGASAGGGPAIFLLSVGAAQSTNNNKFYNNTFVNSRGNYGSAIGLDCFGTCTGNVIRNNVMYDSTTRKLVRWPAGGIFQSNLVFAGGTGNLVDFNGRSFTCSALLPTADVDGDGTGNDKVRCADPKFISATGFDFHLLTGSPAIDSGTSTGMPAGKLASIRNTVAGLHGLPSYADNLPMAGPAWDAGAVEFGSAGAATANLVLSDPSPTASGIVGVTLTTSSAVVQLPGPLTFQESDSSITLITLTGTIPGSIFTGTFTVNSSVSDGLGTFTLPIGSLVPTTGLPGNAIVNGATTLIDKTPPSNPGNLRFGS